MKERNSRYGVHRVPADVELTEVGTAIDDVIVIRILEEDVDSRVLDAWSTRLREEGSEGEHGCRLLRCGSPSR